MILCILAFSSKTFAALDGKKHVVVDAGMDGAGSS